MFGVLIEAKLVNFPREVILDPFSDAEKSRLAILYGSAGDRQNSLNPKVFGRELKSRKPIVIDGGSLVELARPVTFWPNSY